MTITVTMRSGTFAGQAVFTNIEGKGLFTRTPRGDHQQHVGTSQTPTFHSRRHLSAWVRRQFDLRAG